LEERERGMVEAKRRERVEGVTNVVEERKKEEVMRTTAKVARRGTRWDEAE
jgi:hypothetical protein